MEVLLNMSFVWSFLAARIVEVSPYPRRVDLPVLDNAACQAAFYSDPFIYIIDDRVICTGGVQGEGTCFVSFIFHGELSLY